MHHHPQILEDVIDICDVRLNQGTYRKTVDVRAVHSDVNRVS